MLICCTASDCNIEYASSLSRCPVCREAAPIGAAEPTVTSSNVLRRRVAWIAGLMMLLVVLGPFRFHWFSICDQCGARRDSTQRLVPVIRLPYWTTHDVQATRLSNVAAEFMDPHDHAWVFGWGSGHAALCSMGAASTMPRYVDNSQIVAFISATHKFVSPDAAAHYLAYAADHEHCGDLHLWLSEHGFEAAEIETVEQYSEWVKKAKRDIAWHNGLADFATSPAK